VTHGSIKSDFLNVAVILVYSLSMWLAGVDLFHLLITLGITLIVRLLITTASHRRLRLCNVATCEIPRTRTRRSIFHRCRIVSLKQLSCPVGV